MTSASRAAPFFLLLSVACTHHAADAPAPPAWVDAPLDVDTYEGRATTIPVTVRGVDPAQVLVAVFADGVDAELTPPGAPSTDGLWHGSLRLRHRYGATPGSAKLTLDEADRHVEIPLSLRAHALTWLPRTTWDGAAGPPTREHGAFLLDTSGGAAYLLQGSGYHPQGTPLADAWRFDLATRAWTPWTPTGDVPPPAGSRRVAAVPSSKIAYVYGGYEATSDSAELYRVDLGAPDHVFTKLASTNAPLGRELHVAHWDAAGAQLVVFGGFHQDSLVQEALDDTWVAKIDGDAATWTELATKQSPSGRYGSFSALDAESRRLYVYSGAQTPVDASDLVNAADDTWTLDLAATPPRWSKLTPAGATPRGRRNGCAMHDPVGRRLFVFGGTHDGATTELGLFVLDLEPGREEWTKIVVPNAPPIRSSGFGFTTPEGAMACAFGNDRSPYADVNLLGYAP